MPSLEQIEVELRPQIDLILNTPSLRRVSAGTASRNAIRSFALQYGHYCNIFPRCLAAVAANIEDDETRFPLIENLWEEHGSGHLDRSHRKLYEQFLVKLDLATDDVDAADALPSTAEYVARIFSLCRDSHFLIGLGALSLGTEYFTAVEYSMVADGLRSSGFVEEDGLEFWLVHTDVDDRHYDDMKAVMEERSLDLSAYALIREGAISAVQLELAFWQGLEIIL